MIVYKINKIHCLHASEFNDYAFMKIATFT